MYAKHKEEMERFLGANGEKRISGKSRLIISNVKRQSPLPMFTGDWQTLPG